MTLSVPIETSLENIEYRVGQIFLGALTEILGRTQAGELLEAAQLPDLADRSPDFDSDLQFSLHSLNRILLLMKQSYPIHSAQGIAQRVGEASFSPLLHSFGPALGFNQKNFQLLPLRRKLPEAVRAITALLNQAGLDQASFLLEDQHVRLSIPAVFMDTETADSMAHYLTGLLRAGLYWISGGRTYALRADDTINMGEQGCQIIIPLAAAAY